MNQQLLRDCARLLERLEQVEHVAQIPSLDPPDSLNEAPTKCAECGAFDADHPGVGHHPDCELARIKRELLDVLGRVTA